MQSGGASRHLNVPTEWKLEFPQQASASLYGGCRRIEDSYERISHLGQGTYGEVFKAIDKKSKDLVAIKKIKMENEKEGFPITAIREIKILSKLAACENEISGQLLRNNIIRLREIVRSDGYESNRGRGSVYMVFDFMEHDMAGLLDRANRAQAGKAHYRRGEGHPTPFSLSQVKRYMKQLFLGLALLHTHRILHRDLKNANLLVNNKGELKIADFGLARNVLQQRVTPEADGLRTDANHGKGQKTHLMTNRVITLWYRPPELCLGATMYGEEVDMWSAGCIMVEMLTGRALFPGTDEANQVDLICKVLGRPTEDNMPGCTKLEGYEWIKSPKSNYPQTSQLRSKVESLGVKDPKTIDVLQKLLSLDPRKRLRASDAAVLEWFDADPPICALENMPKYESSHELTMKRKRQADREAHNAMDKNHEGIEHWRGRSRVGHMQGTALPPILGHSGAKHGAPHASNQPPPPSWAGEKR